MRHRVHRGLWFLLVALALWPVSALAQPPSSASSIAVPSDPEAGGIGELLDRGRLLEAQHRWGEALTLYEDALRQYPERGAGWVGVQSLRGQIEQRMQLSRIHYDLGRRYNDDSFRRSTSTMPVGQALDLYGEVLLKIQSHYVEAPQWQRLVEQGTTGFEVALSDPLFLEANLPGTPPARVEHFRRQLRSLLPREAAGSRQAAMNLAAAAARLGRQQLGLNEATVVLEYTCGATNALDAYSTFLTAGQLNEVYSQIEGNFVGLGIELKSGEGGLQIIKVIANSPAERSGIRPGDRIVEVDGVGTIGLSTDQAANLLQGPEGSWVQVTALAAGGTPRSLRVRREHVEVPSIDDARILDETFGIAYLKLTCFQKTTSRDLDAALWKLHDVGMRSLIIDLRGNPGGLLTTAVEVVDKFVDRGVIVSTRGRSRQEDYNYSAQEAGTWRLPLVMLIDGDSASASEIFAGAIRDHRRGTIVGVRSYGKGSVQGIFPLNVANSGLRLTTAKFYSPKGLAYSDVGVEPHLAVRETARPDFDSNGAVVAAGDPALDAALRQARQQLGSPLTSPTPRQYILRPEP